MGKAPVSPSPQGAREGGGDRACSAHVLAAGQEVVSTMTGAPGAPPYPACNLFSLCKFVFTQGFTKVAWLALNS